MKAVKKHNLYFFNWYTFQLIRWYTFDLKYTLAGVDFTPPKVEYYICKWYNPYLSYVNILLV